MEFEQPKCVNCLKQYTMKGSVDCCNTENLVWPRRRLEVWLREIACKRRIGQATLLAVYLYLALVLFELSKDVTSVLCTVAAKGSEQSCNPDHLRKKKKKASETREGRGV